MGFAVLANVSVLLLLLLSKRPPSLPELNVAFIGNSMTFVNDIPRLIEALSDGQLTQNSCLHGSLNLGSILVYGNGMYGKFAHKNARSDGGFYDFGACTVPQLLFGHDENLQPNNSNSYYRDDGSNPCFRNEKYFDFLQDKLLAYGEPSWDLVVMNDRSIYPGLPERRNRTIQALQNVYSNYFLQTSARPVFYMTYAYNYTGKSNVGDIPQFTSRIWYGYQQYAASLGALLPQSQQPLVAPVGLAFLVLWEEDFGMWERLFYTDGLHPSQHGSFLIGCILFATLFGRMPAATVAIPADLSTLWRRARRMQVVRGGDEQPYPTRSEAYFLYRVAERVALHGYRPKSLIDERDITLLEASVSV